MIKLLNESTGHLTAHRFLGRFQDLHRKRTSEIIRSLAADSPKEQSPPKDKSMKPIMAAVPKPTKVTNNDFCPKCGQTFPRDQREYHLLTHYEEMNKEVLGALEGIRQQLARPGATQPQST